MAFEGLAAERNINLGLIVVRLATLDGLGK